VIPIEKTPPTISIEGEGQLDKVVDKPLAGVLIFRLLTAELDGNVEQVEAEGGHPGRAIALLDAAAIGKGKAPVKHGDVVEAEETTLEHVVA
jgi:hypothetical protein